MKKILKNSKLFRLLALAMVAILAGSQLAACNNTSESKKTEEKANKTEDISETEGTKSADGSEKAENTEAATELEPVELKMYLLGDKSRDFDEVYTEINKILKDKINAEVTVDFLSWGEHETKYSLLFSAQEDFDLIFTASAWAHYETTTAMGGFEPLTEELLSEYAPDILEVVPEVAWDQARIDGQPYMVPNYQNEFGQDILAVRGDLMEKYSVEDITNWDDLVSFYKKCAEDGIYASQGGPNYQYFQSKGMARLGGSPAELILYHTQDPTDLEFYTVMDWEGFDEYTKIAKELADAGAWSKDVLNETMDRQTSLLTGKAASMTWNLGSTTNYANEANKENPDWKVTIVDPIADLPKQVNSYTNNGVAINAASKNKERALMALNEFYTNPEVQDLARLGIEGKHWEAVGDDQYKLLDQEGYAIDSNCNWGWTNDTIKRDPVNDNPTEVDKKNLEFSEKWNANIKESHPLDGFTFNNANVSSQYAAVESIIATYYTPLVNGIVEDQEAFVKEFRDALESAGFNDIVEELKTQAETYIAEKGN